MDVYKESVTGYCPGKNRPLATALVVHNAATESMPRFAGPPALICKRCNSTEIMKYGTRGGVQNYVCSVCRHKFRATDAPPGMRTGSRQIGEALGMFYSGLSLAEIASQLRRTCNSRTNPSTIYRWVIKYTEQAVIMFDSCKPATSDTWVVDETVVKLRGRNLWFWDIIDDETRFILATHGSRNRTSRDVVTVMNAARMRAGKEPQRILYHSRFAFEDGANAYPESINRVFGPAAKHITWAMFEDDATLNPLERYHGTLNQRIKLFKGCRSRRVVELIFNGFRVDFNFFRPHNALHDRTPGESAVMGSPARSWTDVVRQAR